MLGRMPKEYYSEETKKTEYTVTQPRKWSEKEIEWMQEKKKEGYSSSELAESMNRSEVSVSIKLKRLSKSDGNYNSKHLLDKYQTNRDFLETISPKTILDVFCGEKSFYRTEYENIKTTTNDKDKKFEADYHLDALKFMCLMYQEGGSFDVVDLDPFGSAYDCFDLAIKMAKKGIIITLGELGHKRFKRLDFVGRMYGIETLEDFTTETIVNEIIKVGRKNKKELTPVFVKEWHGISRVYFKIETFKITEQWE